MNKSSKQPDDSSLEYQSRSDIHDEKVQEINEKKSNDSSSIIDDQPSQKGNF